MQTDQIRSTVGVDPATLDAIERVYRAWDAALEAKDVEAAVALYAEDVRLDASNCATSSAWSSRVHRPIAVTFALGSSPTGIA
jgi:hypothetical protein